MISRVAVALLAVFASSLAADSQTGDAAKGRALFASCSGCHNTASDERKMGPSLRSLFGRVTLRNGWRANDESVRRIVLEGYNGMPSFGYSFRPAEMDDLLAYLHTLNAPPAAAAGLTEGENVFRAFCVRCHNNGSRSPAGPDLHGKLSAESWEIIDKGHGGAPGMKDWLDAAARKNLVVYIEQK